MPVKCRVCDTHIAKYKCPLCQLQKYVPVIIFLKLDRLKPQSCSVECYKSHQTTHTDVSSLVAIQPIPNGLPPKPPAAVTYANTSNSHVNGGGPPFGTNMPSSLESSAVLQLLYTRYPQLQYQLKEIYEAATEPLDDQLNEQTFSSERHDRRRGRGRNRGPDRDGRTMTVWSRQKGIKSGIHRLRILRHLKGEYGEGLREFSKLVTSHWEAKELTTTAPEV